MKHLFTKVLFAITPMIAIAKSPISNPFITPDFKIVAENQIFSANPSSTNPNGGDCMATVTLNADVTGMTDCVASDLFHYKVEIDLMGDGTVNYLASSEVNMSYLGIWHYDAADQVYKTYLPPSSQTNFKLSLPAMAITENTKKHQVSWQMSDLCGNVSEAQSLFSVIDKKAPTPYCIALSSALFQTNQMFVELLARDFDKGAFDNCSSQNELFFTFEGAAPILARINEDHFYKVEGGVSVNATAAEYINGKAYKWLPAIRSAGRIWTKCGEFDLNISVWDKYFNTDYCTVRLQITIGCEFPYCQIKTTVKTIKNQPLPNVQVLIEGLAPEYPKVYFTKTDGSCENDYYYKDLNYTLSVSYAIKNRKGVTYADYKLLQNHINGTKPLIHPWQLIAANINHDNKLDKKDLDSLKAILDKKSMPKWVFVVDYDSLNMTNWWYYKVSIKAKCQGNQITNNFTAIKLCDINGDALDTVVDDIKVTDEITSDTAYWRKQTRTDVTLKTHPNPFTDQTTITFGLEKAQNITLHITDLDGVEVFKINIDGQQGENQYIINESQLGNNHLFIARLNGEYGSKIAKLVKVK